MLQTIDSGLNLSSRAHSYPGRQLLTKPSWRGTSDLDMRALQGPDLPLDTLNRLPDVAESRQVGRAALAVCCCCKPLQSTGLGSLSRAQQGASLPRDWLMGFV